MVPVFVGAEDMGNFDSFLLVKETLNWGEFRRIHNHAVIGVTSLDEVRIVITVTRNVFNCVSCRLHILMGLCLKLN